MFSSGLESPVWGGKSWEVKYIAAFMFWRTRGIFFLGGKVEKEGGRASCPGRDERNGIYLSLRS